MAVAEPMKMPLGGTLYTIRPVTISQLEQIEEEITQPGAVGIKRSVALIRVALSRDYADISANVEDLESDVPEIAAFAEAFLVHAGFAPPPADRSAEAAPTPRPSRKAKE